jgi:hypothetical protein
MDTMTPPPAGPLVDDTSTGTWLITTETSTHLLDLDQRLVTRSPAAANDTLADPERIATLRRDNEAVPLIALTRLTVDEPMELLLDIRGDGIVTTRSTTRVLAITPV